MISMLACTTTLPTHSDSCAAQVIYRPIKSFHSLWTMSSSHHSTKLGTIHMSHWFLISTLFHPLQCSVTHFLNNSNFLLHFISATTALCWLIIISCLSLYWFSYTLTAWQSGEIIYVFLLCILHFKDTKC